MSIKSSQASNTLVVALLVCSGASVARAQAIPDGVARNSDAFDTVNTAHASILLERRLRSGLNMMITADPMFFGETGNSVGTAPTQERRLQFSNLGEDLSRLPLLQAVKTAAEKKNRNANDHLLELEKLVKATDEQSRKDATTRMFEIFSEYHNEYDLAVVLASNLKNDLALNLATLQVKKWVSDGKNIAGVYGLLKLDEIHGSELFESELINMWELFGIQLFQSRGDILMYEEMYYLLLNSFNYQLDDLGLVLVTKASVERSIANQLLAVHSRLVNAPKTVPSEGLDEDVVKTSEAHS